MGPGRAAAKRGYEHQVHLAGLGAGQVTPREFEV